MGRCRRHRGPGSGTGSPAAAAAGDPWLLWEFWWVAWEYWREYGVAARPLRGRGPRRGFLVGPHPPAPSPVATGEGGERERGGVGKRELGVGGRESDGSRRGER